MKINCWDFNQCGRQHGGKNVEEFGKCHSVQYKSFNGINGGLFGGRYCWHIAGTFQEDEPTCRHLKNVESCDFCEFYLKVKVEEGENFVQ
ncbi:hypothetical protein KKF86_03980 [bacterium]|nr:hypothetical protein [bacterium]